MFSRKIGFAGLGIAAVVMTVYVVSVSADQPGTNRAGQANAGQAATITGRVVDLHCYMTGQFPSADHAKCTADCIRQGVPVGIDTEQGIVILGQGLNSPAKSVMPFAFQEVEATGKLYTKGDVKYLDLSSIRVAKEEGDDEGDYGVDENDDE